MKRLSIIIVAHNAEKYIGKCIESIYKYIGIDNIKIIAVDNASEDNTKEIIKGYEDVLLISNSVNRGFAAAVNQGLKAIESEWYLLLNQDTELIEDGFSKLLNYKDNCIIGCGLKRSREEKIYKSFFNFPSPIRIFFETSGIKGRVFALNKKKTANVQECDYIEGSFMLFDNKVFKKTGYFDEHYFFYHEEMDYCCRAGKTELGVYYFPDYSIIHYGGASKNMDFPVTYWKYLGYFIYKHYSGLKKVFCYFGAIKGFILRIIIKPFKMSYTIKSIKEFREGYRGKC